MLNIAQYAVKMVENGKFMDDDGDNIKIATVSLPTGSRILMIPVQHQEVVLCKSPHC